MYLGRQIFADGNTSARNIQERSGHVRENLEIIDRDRKREREHAL
jgi:hypothetical protein